MRIDRTYFDALGGYIEFTQRSTNPAAERLGKVQRFRFSWAFSRNFQAHGALLAQRRERGELHVPAWAGGGRW